MNTHGAKSENVETSRLKTKKGLSIFIGNYRSAL